jgi:hypothetical protein
VKEPSQAFNSEHAAPLVSPSPGKAEWTGSPADSIASDAQRR